MRFSQIIWRLWYLAYQPYIKYKPAPCVRKLESNWEIIIEKEIILLENKRIKLLNIEANLCDRNIWNNNKFSKLWLYNLHYFDFLLTKDSNNKTLQCNNLISRWIKENPQAKGVGWEPYPLSLRLVNWIKWLMSKNEVSSEVLDSIAIQAKFLSKKIEYHLLANHLLSNAKALYFAGYFFCGNEADYWKQLSSKIIKKQIDEQILKDGGHFELSPMYHQIVLNDLLDLAYLHKIYKVSPPKYIIEAIKKMLEWSDVMQHPDGDIPFFNDAAFGIAPKPASTEKYAKFLKIPFNSPNDKSIKFFKDSGYARLLNTSATLFVDIASVGPHYNPGHAHADTLSFELSLNGRRIIVNAGTSEYGNSDERQLQRSTISHSTVVIDQKNSSDVWSGFRVGKRANIIYSQIGSNEDYLWAVGAHDGYRNLKGQPIHERYWRLAEKKLIIKDKLTGTGRHDIEIIYPLSPGLIPLIKGQDKIHIYDTLSKRKLVIVLFDQNESVECMKSKWHPYFGKFMETWCIKVKINDQLPLIFKTEFKWLK